MTFLTEYKFERYAGENIQAKTWEEAEAKASDMNLIVVGVLISTTFSGEA